jgi:hypothetical protein
MLTCRSFISVNLKKNQTALLVFAIFSKPFSQKKRILDNN